MNSQQNLETLAEELDQGCREWSDLPCTPSQSPIEATFAKAMEHVLAEFGGGQLMNNDPLDLREVEIDHGYGQVMASFHAYIWNQIKVGKYRADFLVAYRPGRSRGLRYAVIECDGHEFHERTKKQAEHDKRRDRELLEMGIPVLRVTGTEIWRSPIKAAMTVLSSAIKTLQVSHG